MLGEQLRGDTTERPPMIQQRTILGVVLVLLGVALLVASYWGESLVGALLGVGAVLGMAAGVVLVGTAGGAGDARGGAGA